MAEAGDLRHERLIHQQPAVPVHFVWLAIIHHTIKEAAIQAPTQELRGCHTTWPATYPKRIFFKIKHPADHVFPGIASLFFCSIIKWFLPQLSSQDSKKLLASDQIFQPRPSIHGLKHLETQTETAPPPTRK